MTKNENNYLLSKEKMKKTFNTENFIMEYMGDWTIKCGCCGSRSNKIDREYKKGRESIPVCEECVEFIKKKGFHKKY